MSISAASAALLAAALAAPTAGVADDASGPIGPTSVFDSRLYRDLFGTPDMRRVWSDEAMVERWLQVEIALAEAQAEAGVIPASAAKAIAEAARMENIDFDALREATNKTGRGIAPLLKQIRGAGSPEVAEYLHWGGTTQDIMDTATVMQIRDSLELIDAQLNGVTTLLANLAETHRATVMVARTNGQQAIPTTFGLKLAQWMMEFHRHRERLHAAAGRVSQTQIGGAVGTLAQQPQNGLKVRALVAEKLGLAEQVLPWNPSRDNFAETVTMVGLVHGTLGRIATDINNLSRIEIGEVREGEGGASSTMPQKKNPRASEFMGGLAQMARLRMSGALEIMAHTDTRQGAPWIVEWSLIPEMFLITSASLERAHRMFTKLEVNEDRMTKNLEISRGFSMSEAVMMHLAREIGRGKAYTDVKKVIKERGPDQGLREVLLADPELKGLVGDQLDALLDPSNYVGFAPQMVDQAVALVREANGG